MKLKHFRETVAFQTKELPQASQFEVGITCDTKQEYDALREVLEKKLKLGSVILDEKLLHASVVVSGVSHKSVSKQISEALKKAGISAKGNGLQNPKLVDEEAETPQATEKPAIDIAKIADVQQKQQETILDPDMDKELFVGSIDVDGIRVVFKKIGLGYNKPIHVYIDGGRWEIFPSLKLAKREVRKFLRNNDSKTVESEVETPIIDNWDGIQNQAANKMSA